MNRFLGMGPVYLLLITLAAGESAIAAAQHSYVDVWGPPVGSSLPPLHAQDQTGTWRDFSSLKGKHGLLLFMNRSADW